ncbi:MAG: hypothetical protein FK734_07045 [Asgard group archaeon]|nr:hypothetical protein [Asgard group archaeon]
MIENAIIFSKVTNQVVLTSTYNKINPNDDSFKSSLERISDIAYKLEKGVFKLDLEGNLLALILAVKQITVALIFSSPSKINVKEWENAAKEVATGFDKVYEPNSSAPYKHLEFKKTMDEIIQWHQKELSPIDKMKDALW